MFIVTEYAALIYISTIGLVMKTLFLYANDKNTDHPAHPRSITSAMWYLFSEKYNNYTGNAHASLR